MNQQLKIGIVGMGNVGIHFLQRLIELGYTHLMVYSRSENKVPLETVPKEVQFTHDFKEFIDFDIIFCAVNDNNMVEMIQLISRYAPVVSVSGTVELGLSESPHPTGVFYPLQSFSKTNAVHWEHLPIFVESSDPAFRTLLLKLGTELSGNARILNGEQRKHLHVAAVFANNFSNYMFTQAAAYCAEHNLDFDWLKPLIRNTVDKLEHQSPEASQTGPARRNDVQTIRKHLELLQNEDQKTLYEFLSTRIQQHYNSSHD